MPTEEWAFCFGALLLVRLPVSRTSENLVPVLTAEQARAEEENAFRQASVSDRVVLESAGRAVAHAVAAHFPDGRVVAAVGKGKNGADALVALRTLRAWGRDVAAVPVGGLQLPPDLLHGWTIPLESIDALGSAAVALDGLLGTGASGPPRAGMEPVIRALNASTAPVVAIDGPTGVDLSTGRATSVAVEATMTVTFGGLKRGLVLHPGRRLAGRILVAEIGLPPHSASLGSVPRAITRKWAAAHLPALPPDAYKTLAGIVTVVAGRTGMGGAAIMTAMGALRAGAGGVRVISTESNRSPIHAAVPEAVFFDRADNDAFEALTGSAAVVIGPGIGADEAGYQLLEAVLARFAGPTVIDADAITLIAGAPSMLDSVRRESLILTPHPGELARLLSVDTADVLGDRFHAADEVSSRLRSTVLSKGSPSIVSSPGEPPLVSLTGHSGVATGGMGDTLAGIVAAFAAAGATPRMAAALGIHFAGAAAEEAGLGRGLLPRDVAEALPTVLLRQQAKSPMPPFILDLPAPF